METAGGVTSHQDVDLGRQAQVTAADREPTEKTQSRVSSQASVVAELRVAGAKDRKDECQNPTPRSSGTANGSLHRNISKIRNAFTSPRKLVLAAGTVLALCAGIVDAVAFNELNNFVSHVTGNVAHIGIRLEGNYNGDFTLVQLREAWGLVMSFLIGSIICGIIISKNEVHFGKELYGFALVGNSLFLLAATLVPNQEAAMYLAAAACGLQNGICTMHFGAVCRTTHVTGLVTDLGTAIGRVLSITGRKWCRRRKLDILDRTEIEVDANRIRVYCCLLFGFAVGAVVGAWIQGFMRIWALLVPAGITFLGGSCYMVFRQCLKEKLEQYEARRVNEEMQEVEQILERTRSFMTACEAQGEPARFQELNGAMSHALDVMYDVEASIEQLYGASHSMHFEHNANSSMPARSPQSSPCHQTSRPPSVPSVAVSCPASEAASSPLAAARGSAV